MKKLICVLLTLVLAASLAACGAGQDGQAPKPAPSDAVFKYNGQEIPMGAEAEAVVEMLGKPRTLTEQPSCLGGALPDKTYSYGGFYFLTTAGADGTEVLASLWFADDTVYTTKGVTIGSSKSKVQSAYPEAQWQGDTCVVETEEASLAIHVQGGKVESVRYAASGGVE